MEEPVWHSAQPSANAGYIVAQHTAQPAQPADQALAAALQSADESAHVSNSLKHVDETSMQPASQRASASSRPRSSDGSGVALLAPDPLAAALGGLLALTGGVLSYALVRVRGSGKRVRHLKDGLEAKERELTRARAQLAGLQDAAVRRATLEAELAASRAALETTTQELEAARAASRNIESDMRRIEDQVSALAACEHSVAETTQLAEQRIARADAERRAAEERWQAAHTALQAAHDELESVRGELGLRGSQLEGLSRELEFTRRQLQEAEKRAERAHLESLAARSSGGGFAGSGDYGVDADGGWD